MAHNLKGVLSPIVDMAVNVQMPLPVSVPFAYGIMTQADVSLSIHDMCHLFNRLKIAGSSRIIQQLTVMVAHNQMLFSRKLPQIPFRRPFVPVCKIPRNIDRILLPDPAVPEPDQRVIHLRYRIKGGDCQNGSHSDVRNADPMYKKSLAISPSLYNPQNPMIQNVMLLIHRFIPVIMAEKPVIIPAPTAKLFQISGQLIRLILS